MKNSISVTPAGLFRRLMSMLYDALVLAGLVLLAQAMLVLPLGLVLGKEQWELIHATTWMRALTQALTLVIIMGFHIGFWAYGGQTVGMRAWRLLVRRNDGGPLSFGDALKRYLAAWLSAAAFGIGFLACLWDPEQRTWHDRLSGTKLLVLPRGR